MQHRLGLELGEECYGHGQGVVQIPGVKQTHMNNTCLLLNTNLPSWI